VLLPIVELPIRLLAAFIAGRWMWDWLGEEGVVYVEPIESRFLLVAALGAGALAAVMAPLVTTRPLLFLIELAGRLGPFRLVGAAIGLLLGLAAGALLAVSFPRVEEGPLVWLPLLLSLALGLAGAVAFGARPGIFRRFVAARQPAVRRPTVRTIETVPAEASLPAVNGHIDAAIEAPKEAG
jgi:hypothetical protein